MGEERDKLLEQYRTDNGGGAVELSDEPRRAVRRPLSVEEHRQRRIVCSRLLHTALTFDEICEIMARPVLPNGRPGFRMSVAQVRQLITEIYARWADEDAGGEPYRKAAARRRIAEELRDARKAGAWTAIANLEKVLACIEGTNAPIEVSTPAGTRLSDALLAVLGASEELEVRELIERERSLVEHSARPVHALATVKGKNGVYQIAKENQGDLDNTAKK